MSIVYSLSSVSHNGDQGTFMDRVIQITKNVRMETVRAEAERIEREIESMRRDGSDDDVAARKTLSDKKVHRKSDGWSNEESMKPCNGNAPDNTNPDTNRTSSGQC